MQNAHYPSLTPQELVETGQALYGPAWRTALAHVLGVSESDIVMVESGSAPAPHPWRATLVALAQDTALRALEAANNLMWREGPAEEAPAQQPLYAPQPPRMA